MNTQKRKRTPLRRLFSLIMALFMAVMILPDVKPLKAQAATEYKIWIYGHKVTSDNLNDILGSSSSVKFSFVPNENTLHVKSRDNNNATIYTMDTNYWIDYSGNPTNNNGCIIYSEYSYNLTISIDNDVTFVDNKGITPIYIPRQTNLTTTLTGSGKLTYNGSSTFIHGANVSFDNADLDLSCNYYILYNDASDYPPQLNIKNSNVTVRSSCYLTYNFANSNYSSVCELTNCYISEPDGAHIYKGYWNSSYGNAGVKCTYVADANDYKVSSFTIKAGKKPAPVTVYDGLKIRGTQVTSENKDDILGNGAISYNPDTKTLTIHKDIISNTDTIIENTGIDGLNITSDSENGPTLWGMTPDPVIYTTKDINFTGSKPLSLATNSAGIRIRTIGGYDPTVNINSPLWISAGTYGIFGDYEQTLNLNNSNIYIYNTDNNLQAAVIGIRHINLGSGIVLDKPQPYTINSNNNGGIRGKNGDFAKEVKTTSNYSIGISINGTNLDASNARDPFGDGKVSYDKDEKTLYIEGTYSSLQCQQSELNVVLTGDTTITGYATLIHVSLTGTGKLTCNNINAPAFTSNGVDIISKKNLYSSTGNITIKNGKVTVGNNLYTSNSNLVFENVDLNVNGSIYTSVSSSSTTNGKITINNSNVNVGGDLKTVYGNITISGGSDVNVGGNLYSEMSTVNVSGSSITAPVNCVIGKSANYNSAVIFNNSTTLASGITIARENYGLTYGGKVIDSTCDLNNIDGNNKISYDPDTKTLTLKGTPSNTGNRSIRSTIPGLIIKVQNDTDLTGVYGYVNTDIQVDEDTTITGPGKLTVSDIKSQKGLTLDNVNIKVDHPTLNDASSEIISAKSDISIINSDLEISGKLYTTNGGINLDNCHLAGPNGAKIEAYGNGSRVAKGAYDATGVKIKKGYGFSICGTEVTAESNLYRLGPDGAFEYDPETNTLTLNKDVALTSDSSTTGIYNESNIGLIINGNGHKMTTNCMNALEADTVFTGKLNIVTRTTAFRIDKDPMITIKDADIYANANNNPIFKGTTGCTATMKIINSSVDLLCATKAIQNINNGIYLEECIMRYPSIASSDTLTTIPANRLTITPIEYYPLYVAGVQVSELNCAKLIDDDGDKTYYSPASKTLYIDTYINGNNNWCIDNQGVDGLVIYLDSSNTLNSLTGCIRIANGLETTIDGDEDTLTLKGETGINCGSSSKLFIARDSFIKSSTVKNGIFCESGDASIEMFDSTINITNAANGALYGFGNGVTMRGCELKTNGCVINNGSIVASANNLNSAIAEIGPVSNKIDISNATMYLNTITYCYDGQAHQPMAVLKYNGKTLELDKDYKYSCPSQSATGTYEAVATGIGDFTGKISAEWKIAEMYSVKYTAGTTYSKKMYESKTSATVKAPNISGKKFWRWETIEGKILSYSQSYSFIVTKDVELEAKYVSPETNVEILPILDIETSKTKLNGQNALYFEFTHSVPYDYTVQEVGILYATNKMLGYTSGTNYAQVNLMENESFNVEYKLENNTTGKVKNTIANYKKNNGRFAHSYGIGNNVDSYVYAVGYVIIKDKNGVIQTFYSNVVATTYNKTK